MDLIFQPEASLQLRMSLLLDHDSTSQNHVLKPVEFHGMFSQHVHLKSKRIDLL